MKCDLTRRDFLRGAAAVSVGFGGLATLLANHGFAVPPEDQYDVGYGPLVPDPAGVMDLPAGFTYSIIGRGGDPMSDGLLVPGRADGMAAFPGPGGTTLLVRNHELDAGMLSISAYGPTGALAAGIPANKFYDAGVTGKPALGCTTTVKYHAPTGVVLAQWLSIAGTVRNCAGGPTPWGSWLTCEEDVAVPDAYYAKKHGYVFEVPATGSPVLHNPVAIPEMGRFRHEAVAMDPATGIVYLTEDRDDGLIYRFIPNVAGNLHSGGVLQALGIQGNPGADLRNWNSALQYPPGTRFQTTWHTMSNVDPATDDLRYRGHTAGAALFARGEGMWFGRDSIFFACTSGGLARKGQIWRYLPGRREMDAVTGTLELFIEPNNGGLIDNCDNVTVAPWGDLFVCEDGSGTQYVVAVTPGGRIYRFARNASGTSELAGAVFSPDGSTFFVNIHVLGLTLAIKGPWWRRRDRASNPLTDAIGYPEPPEA